MISNHFKNVFTLSKQPREILWLGDKNEEPPKSLGGLLSRIQFLPYSRLKNEHFHNIRALVVSVNLNSVPEVGLFQSHSLLNLPKYLVLPSQAGEVPEALKQLINTVNFQKVFILPEDSEELSKIFTSDLEQKPVEPKQVPMETDAVKTLENEFTDLELLVQQGTEHVASAKREIELKVTHMRKLIRFLEELASLHSISELMKLIRHELKEFHHLKDPVLVLSAFNKPIEVYYFQGAQVYKRSIDEKWPTIVQARFNDIRDSQYLADLFSRPFARLFSVPIQIRPSASTEDVSSGVLYFEHSLLENEKRDFVEYLDERLSLIGVALDRLFLESDLREASIIWERTFDEIADPVAIFDDDKNLVRSNKAFQMRFSGMEKPNFSKDNIHYKGRSFEVRRYPITGGDGLHSTNVVIHYLDVTLSHQLQKQMIQQEKMAALGHLAGNIAHELNNPLTGIQSMAQILSQ